MARKGENIFQRNTGVWEARYIKERVNGKIRYGYITGKSYEEVYWKKQEKLKELELAKNSQFMIRQSNSDDRLIVIYVAKEWLETQERFLKQNTIARYYDDLNRHILPEFGERYIDEITRDEVSKFSMKLYEYSRKRLNNKLKFIQKVHWVVFAENMHKNIFAYRNSPWFWAHDTLVLYDVLKIIYVI